MNKIKLAVLTLVTGVALHLGGCGGGGGGFWQFWGDLVGDALWLRGID